MTGEVPEKVIEYVNSREYIRVDDLEERFAFKKSTSYSYLSRLEKRGVISRIGYGRYKVGKVEHIEVSIMPRTRKIVEIIRKKMPFAEFVIWSTENLSDFTHYTIGKNIVFIEAEHRLTGKIKDALLDHDVRAIVEPTKVELKEVFTYFNEPVLILKRREKYATQKIDGILVPQIERMLVDLYFLITRKKLPFPPDELGRILYNILYDRTLNLERLKRYASRRLLTEEISVLLSRFKREYPDLDIPFLEEKLETKEKVIDEIVKGALK